MHLVIDIGNTNINLGLFQNGRLQKQIAIPSSKKSFYVYLRKIFLSRKPGNVIISSVVPGVLKILLHDLRRLKVKKPFILGRNFKVPIVNKYRYPNQVGQDRLVNAFAAIKLYGAPSIVVDFGTAITFDVISKKNEYLGGMILPGLEISLGALYEKTALLPKVKLNKPKELVGRDTKNSILSGIVYGFASLTDELINKLKDTMGKGTLVIATGGNIPLISAYCKHIDKKDKHLTLKGLNLLLS